MAPTELAVVLTALQRGVRDESASIEAPLSVIPANDIAVLAGAGRVTA